MVFALRTLGTVLTVLASVVPARRATRVPPIAAVREGSTLPPGLLVRVDKAGPFSDGYRQDALGAWRVLRMLRRHSVHRWSRQ
jgi:hypothetical protein